jgi:chromosome segregation ATPase
MQNIKSIISSLLLFVFSISIISCDPTQKQLAKEKARTEETVKKETDVLKNEISNLKNEIKLSQLKSELALVEYKLESLQKPKEFKTQFEQASEIDGLNAKIESLNSEITSIENSINTTK